MKLTRILLVAAMSCCLPGLQAAAQYLGAYESMRPTALSYNYYVQDQAEASPSDLPRMAQADSSATCEAEYDTCCDDEPWRLFPELWWGWSWTGWLEMGSTASADHPASRFVTPVRFNDRQEVQLNQYYTVLERPVDTSCGCWDLGGRMDLLFGTDARFTEVPGLELRRDGSDHWNTRSFYRLSMPQAYAEVGWGNLSVKAGHWYTTIGYEVVTAPDNFFYSHAYTMLYAEPFTHTGVLSTYQYTDRLTFYSGIHNGWDSFDATTNRGATLSGFSWTSCDERLGVAFALTSGDEINNLGVYSDRTMYSLVVNYQVGDRLQYVLQHDNGWQEDDGGAGLDAEWYGLNQYLLYTMNDCWAAGLRTEWFRDDDGTRVPGSQGNTGFVGHFYEVTLGLNWKPGTNVVIRPEVRWDWFDGTGLPYDDGTKDSQFTAAFDAILLY